MHLSPVTHNFNCDKLFTIATALSCRRIALLLWDVALSSAFYLVVHQPCNEEGNKHVSPDLQPVFCFIKLALVRMPIFTRRSRAGTLQIIPTRLSKNGPMVTFASDASLL